jgi:hypothetical protein
MGKKIKWRCRTRPLSRKSTASKIEAYIDSLKNAGDSEMTTNRYLILVHNFIKKRIKGSKKVGSGLDPYRYVRVCKGC